MNEAAKFSILIPSWNNLDYVRLCFDSIKKNSRYQHQLILHINDGSDGTLQWAKDQGIDHTHSVDNIGICLALNQAASLAKTDYIVYMNDDMYVCPDWDLYLWEEISSLNHNQFFISSTMIEPTDTGNACVIGGKNFGTNTDEFREQDLLEQYASLPMNDWQGATWPPNIVHKSMWDLVGGYSIELSPGMYSDPDFSMKLWKCGVRYFKGLAKSRVYHFQCKSTGRKIQLNPGRKQFLSKWGMASSTFMREYLGIGKPFVGPIPNPDENGSLKKRLRLDKIKRRLSA